MNSHITIALGAVNKEALATLQSEGFDTLLLLQDKVVSSLCSDLLDPIYTLIPPENRLSLSGGEELKGLETVSTIIDWLIQRNATRHSLLLVVGGGAILDLGGFVGAIYKRGLTTAYVPTTLMAMVDASVGGKTAIDYKGIKNLIGAFALPHTIIIDPRFLATLPDGELLSGYWEVVKHALLSGDEAWKTIKRFAPLAPNAPWEEVIRQNIETKQRYVSGDLHDNGMRQFLNLGHTVGHALEGFSRSKEAGTRPVLRHGEAVCIGMICELYIAHQVLSLDFEYIRSLIALSRELLAPYPITCRDYPHLLNYMHADKKNQGSDIAIIGLRRSGVAIKMNASEVQIKNAFDFFRETFGQ